MFSFSTQAQKNSLVKAAKNVFNEACSSALSEEQKEFILTFITNYQFVLLNAVVLSKLALGLKKELQAPLDAFLDRWLKASLKSLQFTDSEKNPDKYAYLLIICMKSAWQQSADYLIDQRLGINGRYLNRESKYHGFHPLLFAIKNNDQIYINKLLPISDLNLVSFWGVTALSLAIVNNNYRLAKQLIAHPDVHLVGRNFGESLFDLIRNHDELFFACVNKFKDTFTVSGKTWEELLYFPLSFLDKDEKSHLKNMILSKINSLQVFEDHPNLKQDFILFIENSNELPFKRLDRLTIATECLMYLMAPNAIKQGDSNLCGPACLMQYLAYLHPEKFIQSVLGIAELEKQTFKDYLPARIKNIPQTTKEKAYCLSDLWLDTVRHNYNFILSYSKRSPIEPLAGITPPSQLVSMFKDFDCDISHETFQVRLSPRSHVLKATEQIRRHLPSFFSLPRPLKIYSQSHREISNDKERFQTFLDQLKEKQPILIPILINGALLNQLLVDSFAHEMYFMEASHYVNIKKVNYDPTNKMVSFKLLTYGFELPCQIPANRFAKGFLGSLTFIPEEGLKPAFSSQK